MISDYLKEEFLHEVAPGGTPWGSIGDTIDWLNDLLETEPLTEDEKHLLETAIKHLEDYQSTLNLLLGVAIFGKVEK